MNNKLSVKLKAFIYLFIFGHTTQHVRLVPRPGIVLEPPQLALWSSILSITHKDRNLTETV